MIQLLDYFLLQNFWGGRLKLTNLINPNFET